MWSEDEERSVDISCVVACKTRLTLANNIIAINLIVLVSFLRPRKAQYGTSCGPLEKLCLEMAIFAGTAMVTVPYTPCFFRNFCTSIHLPRLWYNSAVPDENVSPRFCAGTARLPCEFLQHLAIGLERLLQRLRAALAPCRSGNGGL